MKHKIVIVGGGLSGGLLAWTLHHRREDIDVTVYERGGRIGGEHTWSFHESDVSEEGLELLLPFVRSHWDRHHVQFPEYRRTLQSAYYSIRSEIFHNVITKTLGPKIKLREPVEIMSATEIMHQSGDIEKADVVIDARGLDPTDAVCGYQKFYGLDLKLERPHGLSGPVLMDATVPQIDGYRFFYLLPWSDDQLLIEDTYYSNRIDLNANDCRSSIFKYCEEHNWKIEKEEHEEIGILPIPLLSVATSSEVPTIGTRAGAFQWVTGYSLGDAIATAIELSHLQRWSPLTVTRELRARMKRQRFQYVLYLLLNRMLFWGAKPEGRIRIFERFYTLSESLIQRFYAGRMKVMDVVRIFCGKPPIPIGDAFKSLVRSMEWN